MALKEFPYPVVICAMIALPSVAQDGPELGWYNSTELSFVFTDGNSDTETLGLDSTGGKRWTKAYFEISLSATTSDTADDRFLLVPAGVTWEPGETPVIPGDLITISPPKEPDVEKYAINGFYDRNISATRSWRAGLGWDRDEDAGILDRYVAFGNVGNLWRDTEKRRLYTGYGLSYTDRTEETPDPEKDDRFAGAKFDLDYSEKFGKAATFQADLGANMNLKDTNDYSLDATTSIGVELTGHLSLKVSLRGLYNAEPALEDVDIFAQVILVDPDGIPGNGDEFFETVPNDQGIEIELGEGQIRKEELDTIFRTSLVINW